MRRPIVTLAACLIFLLLANVSTTSVPMVPSVASAQEYRVTPALATGASVDSIIHLKQWQSQYGGNDHWYGILAVLHDWLEADSIARTLPLDTMFGYLATIQGASENYFIFDSILAGADPPTSGDQIFLGGARQDGVWGWVTNEPFCYANWAQGEPNYSWENAISMWGPYQSPQPTPPGSWNNSAQDAAANSLLRFWAVVEWGTPNMSPVAICGNGVAECTEECDDGNGVDNDGCNAACVNEVCGDGIVQPWEECDDGNLIAGDGCDPVCSLQVCGNGILEPGEDCDDGNLLSDDGCNGACDLEVCGDGVRQPWEECDDGNTTAGDSCDPICRAEVCGNGRLDAGECCDDSNLVGGDGCSPACLEESSICGNGTLECPEECDDGNLLNHDGCESTCTITCIPGDVNLSHTATSSDVIILLNYVFLRGGPPKPCWSAGDMNCNSVITSADIITLINHLFKSMPLAECDRCAPCGR